jgi:hypothetical protein
LLQHGITRGPAGTELGKIQGRRPLSNGIIAK